MRIDSDWNHYHYTYGEPARTAQVRFDVGCALMPAPNTHATSVRVRIRITDPEQDLDHIVRQHLGAVDCWLVGTIAFADITAFVFQVAAVQAMETHLAALLEQVDAEVHRSDGWSFFEDQVCPQENDWRRITDREQLERLGIDASAPVPVVHGFYGSAKGIAAIHARLQPEGFVGEPLGDRLEMTKTHRPAEVSDITVPLLRLAQQHGCAYDGWRLA
jgi:hypothetical protein